MGSVNLATSWFQPDTSLGNSNIMSSSDYYNECAPFGSASVTVSTYAGHQSARTGAGYAGIQVYDGENISMYQSREYIETSLIAPLIQGKKYCVEFYVSLADTTATAISNLGACFTSDSLLYSSPWPYYQAIILSPQIENTQGMITDKENWILVSDTFIAVGGEKFITIGNFRSDTITNSQNVGGSNSSSYYFFDDVSVYDCDIVTTIPPENNLFVPNAFSPNGDGNNDFLFVRGKNIVELNFAIYSRWGEKVFETINISEGWDGTFRGEKMESAVFAYYLTLTYADGKTEVKKGNISLIR